MRVLHALIGWANRVRALARRRRIARDIDDELAFHLAMREADRAGAGDADPARAARRRFGNVAVVKDEVRDMWTFPTLESIWQDTRYALRWLRRTPGFTIVAVLALAVGIGANTAIFSLVEAVFVRGLPYPNAGRLVLLIGNVQRAAGVERRGGSYPDYLDWRTRATHFDDLAAWDQTTMTLAGSDGAERIGVEPVSPAYFDLLGQRPTRGRTFRPDEDVPDNCRVVVLSDGLWRRRFGADPDIVGRPIEISSRQYDVVGILPAGFRGLSDRAEAWVPFAVFGPSLEARGRRWFSAVARLKPGATIEQAQSELDAVSANLARAYPDTDAERGVEISPLAVETFGDLEPALRTLMGAVAFVLLIACANVANLLIGRSEARQREMAVRTALGAGTSRLWRQLVTESLVLSLVGAGAGLAAAQLMVRALIATSPVTLPSFVDPGLDWRVLLFTTGCAVACGLLLGLAPLTHARVARLGEALKASARGSSRSGARLRGVLVVVEVSVAVVLVVGAGLLIQSVRRLTAIDPGFNPDGVVTLSVNIPRRPVPAGATPAPDAPPPPLVASPDELLARVRALPGVTAASLASDVPLGGSSSAIFYAAEGDTTTDAQTRPRAYVHRVTPEFFQTMAMPLVAGRTFAANEVTDDSTAVVVSEDVVRRFWPNQDPIGRRIKPGSAGSSAPWLTIVGVVPDVKYRGLPDNPTTDPDLYFPFGTSAPQAVIARTAVDPASLVPAIRDTIRQLSPAIVVYGAAPMTELVAAQTAQTRFTTWLLGVFAATALALAVIGLYGVMSYLVAQRRREFGIRLALGARRPAILWLVFGHGARLIASGLVIGSAAAFALSGLLASLLFDVTVTDAASAVALAVLAVVALAACTLPAWRATQVDPVVALRVE